MSIISIKIVNHRNLSIGTTESFGEHAKQFLKRTYEKYGPDKYTFPSGMYLGAQKKVQVNCKFHGEYPAQIPGNFFKYGCPNCKKQVKFFKKATKKFKRRFDYSNVKFVEYRHKVEIGCSIHGMQLITPEMHLKHGCMPCAKLEKFKKTADIKFNRKYDYSKIITVDTKKLEIVCPKHGVFFQTKGRHLNINCKGCPKCSYEKASTSRKTNATDFLARVNKIHKNKYTYSLPEKIALRQTIVIICPKHGSFEQTASSHQAGRGCPKCGITMMSNTKRFSHEKWLELAIAVHGNRFDYSESRYQGRKTRVLIRCIKHNHKFKQNPHNHLNKPHCCEHCEVEAIRSSSEEFIKKAIQIHGDAYDYSSVKYIDSFSKVVINCKTHGGFFQQPSNHLSGNGCPACQESHGEKRIAMFLNKKKLPFIRNATFKGLKSRLSYDFYLKDLNLLIEFDGEQHYKPVTFFGGQKQFQLQQLNDSMKEKFASSNNLKFLRIRYDQFESIEQILMHYLENVLPDRF